MKIAIPIADGQLCLHFGHCQQFAIIAVDDDKNIIATEMLTPPPHAPGVIPKWLAQQNANLIIAGGMGQRAVSLFNENNIEVIIGVAPDTSDAIVKAYLAGNLQIGDNVCDH